MKTDGSTLGAARWSRLSAVVIVLALVGGACGDDSGSSATGDGSATTATGPAEPLMVTVSETGITAEGTLAGNGGEMIVVNETDRPADAQLVSIGDRELVEFAEDLGPMQRGGPLPAYLESAGGVGTVAPGGTETAALSLPPGEYVLFTNAVEGSLDAIDRVEVTADGPGRPESDGWVVASDYTFNLNLDAGAQTVTFTNRGPDQFHHMALRVFPEGLNESEARRAMETLLPLDPGVPPPPDTPAPVVILTSAAFAPGDSGTIDIDLVPDRQYFIGCFIADREGGAPHTISNGMWDIFSV